MKVHVPSHSKVMYCFFLWDTTKSVEFDICCGAVWLLSSEVHAAARSWFLEADVLCQVQTQLRTCRAGEGLGLAGVPSFLPPIALSLSRASARVGSCVAQGHPSLVALVSGSECSSSKALFSRKSSFFRYSLHKVWGVKVKDNGGGESSALRGTLTSLLINSLQRKWEGEEKIRMEKYHTSLELESYSFLSVKSHGLRTCFFMTWGKIRSHNSFLTLNENIIYFPSFAILSN